VLDEDGVVLFVVGHGSVGLVGSQGGRFVAGEFGAEGIGEGFAGFQAGGGGLFREFLCRDFAGEVAEEKPRNLCVPELVVRV